jgi:hypothetical protein
MTTQNSFWNNLLDGDWNNLLAGDLNLIIPPFNMSSWDSVIPPIPSLGDLAFSVGEESIPVIDPPEELDEEEMPGLTEASDELNNAFWEEFHPAEPLEEDPLPEENDLPPPAPILEALRGEAAADVSPPPHRKERSE